MVRVYENNFAQIPIDNDFKLFDILWEDCQNSKEYIENHKDNPKFKKLVPILYKQDGTLINLDKKDDLAMNFFRQFVLARQKVYRWFFRNFPFQNIILSSVWLTKFTVIDIHKFFTERELEDLGGDVFVRNYYEDTYGKNNLQYIPKKYLTLKKESGYIKSAAEQIVKFGTSAAVLLLLYVAACIIFPVLRVAVPYVSAVLGASVVIGGISHGLYIASRNRSYNKSLNVKEKNADKKINTKDNSPKTIPENKIIPKNKDKNINRNNNAETMIEVTHIIPKDLKKDFDNLGSIGINEDDKDI